MTASIFPSKSSMTCCASVGLGFPEIFALGAAIGHPERRTSSRQEAPRGIRIPTVSRPPVVTFGMISFAGTIMVIGPGQKVFIRISMSSVTSAASSRISS